MSTTPSPALSLVAINLTRRCNLACAHCYLDAKVLREGDPGELDAIEICALLDDIASRGNQPLVVLTGGEPLLRRDLEIIVSHGARLGLTMVLGSNGTALTEHRAQVLKRAGLAGVGISLDSLDPQRHDAFRGLKGCWQKACDGIDAAVRNGLQLQLHFTVTADNAHELPAVIEFARKKSARVLNIFFLVCTGRARAMTDITPAQYDAVLAEIIEAQQRHDDLIIRPRCAPHFKRIAYQSNPASALARVSGFDGDGCIAGVHYCRVAPDGEVTACPYIEQSVGNIRSRSLLELWDNSEQFAALREPVLTGRCGACEFRRLCGGCRARGAAQGEGLMASDPLCEYRPVGGSAVIPWPNQAASGIRWSADAEKRLERIPGFVRQLVKSRAEAYVSELGQTTVLPEHLTFLAERRFGKTPPGFGSAQ